jgi:hypothetical protein
VHEAGYIRLPSNLTLKPCNMHFAIEKIRKEFLDLYGYQGFLLRAGKME